MRVKAKPPTPPFQEWLLHKVLQLFSTETNNIEFFDKHKLNLLYDIEFPSISPFREFLLKKTAKQTLTKLDIKNGANLYRQNYQFQKQTDNKVDSLLIHHLKAHKLNEMLI